MMPPMSTTNFPKPNSNFSIDWLVKSDKPSPAAQNNVKNSDKSLPSPQLSAAPREPITKDYDREISTALRLQSPANSDDLESRSGLRPSSASPRSEAGPFYDYRSGPAPSDPHLVRPLPFIPPAGGVDPKLSYFDKSMHPMHQQPTSPTMPHPMDASMQQQQFINAQIQMAAALNYQRQAAGHPQALNFSQIFSNNFHRTSYQMQPWLLNRRFPYGFNGGECQSEM